MNRDIEIKLARIQKVESLLKSGELLTTEQVCDLLGLNSVKFEPGTTFLWRWDYSFVCIGIQDGLEYWQVQVKTLQENSSTSVVVGDNELPTNGSDLATQQGIVAQSLDSTIKISEESLKPPLKLNAICDSSVLSDDFILLIEEGESLFKLGRYQDSFDCCDQIVKMYPNYYDGWFLSGNALFTLGRYQESLKYYSRAVTIGPNSYTGWWGKGSALSNLNRLEEALDAYNQALKLNPNSHIVWQEYGKALFKLGRYQESLESHNRAVTIDPNSYTGWWGRGNALSSLGAVEEALDAYNQALKLNPNSHQVWVAKSVVFQRLGNYQEVLNCCDNASTIYSDYIEGLDGRGGALYSLGRFEEALKSYERVLEIQSDYQGALHGKGNTLLRLGDAQKAVESYDLAIEIEPNSYSIWLDRSAAVNVISSDFKTPLTYPTLNKGGYEGMLGTLIQGIQYCDRNGQGRLYHRLGIIYESYMKNYTRASYSHQKALEILTSEAYPEEHLEVLQSYIRCLYRLGQNERAESHSRDGKELLERLIENTPSPYLQKKLRLKFTSFSQYTINFYVRKEEYWTAIEYAEKDKNLCMEWFFDDTIPPLKDYFQSFKDLLSSNTAAIYWHHSPAFLTTFILQHNSEPIVTTQDCQELETWLTDWKKTYQDFTQADQDKKYETDWYLHLEAKLHKLGEILGIEAIASTLSSEVKQIILLSHRELHCLPLNYLFPNQITTNLPSLKASLVQPTSNTKSHLSLIVDAEIEIKADDDKNTKVFPKLPLVEPELAIVRQYLGGEVIRSTASNSKAAIQQLQSVSTLHYCGHSIYNPTKPAESSLIWNQDEQITALELFKLPNSIQLYQVFLSSCESGLTGKESITTEYVGFPGVFLKRGARFVISTQWQVDDTACYFFANWFYTFAEECSAPEAVYRAARSLKNWSKEEITTFWFDIYRSEDKNLKLLKLSLDPFITDEKEDYPFSNPYYWAGFICHGQF